MEALNPLIEQIGAPGALLTIIVPLIVQGLKKISIFKKLQEDGYKVFEIAPMVLAIIGAFALKLPVPLVWGVVSGFAGQKGYDFIKEKGTEK